MGIYAYLEARTFSTECAKNYEYWFKFLQVRRSNTQQFFETRGLSYWVDHKGVKFVDTKQKYKHSSTDVYFDAYDSTKCFCDLTVAKE